MERLSEKVYCRTCKTKTNHGIIYTHEVKSADPFGFQWVESYHVIQCLGCDTIAFAHEYGDEDMHSDGQWFSQITVYPEQPKNTKYKLLQVEKKKYFNVPEKLLELYEQVIEAYDREYYLLCGAGLRMLIEAICNDLGIENGGLYDENGQQRLNDSGQPILSNNLEGKINGLMEKRLILPGQAKTMHAIRKIGNDTVHEIKTPSIMSLKLCIEIINNLFLNIYELDKYPKILSRR